MTVRIDAPTSAAIACAVDHLRAGRLVGFPTETVYGLGADAGNPDAVRRIFAAKGRPADHPVIVHLYDTSQLALWAREVPAGARDLATAFWPGPLTLILPRAQGVPDIVTGGQDKVGLRMPSHPVARALLRAFAGGIAAPSANRFGRISPTTARHVADDLGDAVAQILDGGACAVGIESTIVAFVNDDPVLLRPGGIDARDLHRVLGRAPGATDEAAPRASGTLASHYAPKTPANLVAADALRAQILQLGARDESVAVLARTVARPSDFAGAWLRAPADAAAFARWEVDAEYMRQLDSGPHQPHRVQRIKEGIEKEQQEDPHTIGFSVHTLADDKLIGFVAFDGISWQHGDTFVAIGIGDPAYRGNGYGTDAMRVMLRYGFLELNLQRVQLNVFSYNERAIKSYCKAGFIIEGCMRGMLRRDGQRWDFVYMSVLRAEWMTLNNDQ
jgi:L-threonylcarbamoyladenylate synthase